jgi:hypothetical protein
MIAIKDQPIISLTIGLSLGLDSVPAAMCGVVGFRPTTRAGSHPPPK